MTLEEAVKRGLADEVKRMIENGKAADCKSKNEALLWAIMAEQVDVVAILLEHGADSKGYLNECSSALHIAAEFENSQITKLLIKYGADVNSLDVVGTSVLIRSIDAEGSTGMHRDTPPDSDVTKILLDAGADPSLPCADGDTPLKVARYMYHPEAERLLKERIKDRSKD